MSHIKDYQTFVNEEVNLDQSMARRIQAGVASEFVNINRELGPILDQIKKNGNLTIDTGRILTRVQNWIITSIPAEIPKMKAGIGGEDWARRFAAALGSIITEEATATLTGTVKTLIKGYFIFKGKSGFVKDTVAMAMKPLPEIDESPLEKYYRNLYNIILKISNSARYKKFGDSSELAEIVPYSKAIRTWENSALEYLDKNQRSILTNIISLISNIIWK